MGTNGDSEPVSSKGELEKVLGQLGWSKRRLARVVYAELNDDDDPGEISRLEERIKKEFQRSSTNPDRFLGYLRILEAQPGYKKLSRVTPNHLPCGVVSKLVLSGIGKISDEISAALVAEEKRQDTLE